MSSSDIFDNHNMATATANNLGSSGGGTSSVTSSTQSTSHITTKPPAPTPPTHQPVRLIDMPWFHGKITREEAEELLNPKESQDGLFLVRESTNFPGDYTLCVVFQGKVDHYRVMTRNNSLTIDEEDSFDNLSKLIEVCTSWTVSAAPALK